MISKLTLLTSFINNMTELSEHEMHVVAMRDLVTLTISDSLGKSLILKKHY